MEDMLGDSRIEVVSSPALCVIRIVHDDGTVKREECIFGIDVYFKTKKIFHDQQLIAFCYRDRFVTKNLFQNTSRRRYKECLSTLRLVGGEIV